MKSCRYARREFPILGFAGRLRECNPLAILRLYRCWREPGAGTRRVVESALTESGVNRKNLDQRFALGSPEAIKSLVNCQSSRKIGRPVASEESARLTTPNRIQHVLNCETLWLLVCDPGRECIGRHYSPVDACTKTKER
jgi:hypothetical protein